MDLDLTPDQAAAIKDMAERYVARRARGVKTGAAVTRNNWTPLEAKINGCRNDLRSAEIRLRNAIEANNDAERTLAEAGVAHHTARLEALLAT